MIRKFSNYLSYFEGAKILINRYTIVENLRNFVSPYNSSLPYFFGRKFNITNFVFFSGGAGKQSGCRWSSMLITCFSGYILSREALRRVFELGLSKQKCQGSEKEYFEDVNMSMQISTMIQALYFEAFQTWTGKCVREVNGIFGNTTDQFGRQRFMPYRLNDFYSGEGIYIGFMQNSGIEHQLVITIWFFSKNDSYLFTSRVTSVVPTNPLRSTTSLVMRCKCTSTLCTDWPLQTCPRLIDNGWLESMYAEIKNEHNATDIFTSWVTLFIVSLRSYWDATYHFNIKISERKFLGDLAVSAS